MIDLSVATPLGPFQQQVLTLVPQVIESFQGYCPAPQKRTLYGISVICSLGITWLLTKGVPKAALYLVLEPCSASDATFVLAKVVSPPLLCNPYH